MARLEHLKALSAATTLPGLKASIAHDAHITVTSEERLSSSHRQSLVLGLGDARITLTFDPGGTIGDAHARVGVPPSVEHVQRFNRLFKALGAEMLWYHRTGALSLHLPGSWQGLPFEVWYDFEAGRLSWRIPGEASWHPAASSKAAVARRDPVVAPSATPTPIEAPEAPVDALRASSAAALGDERHLFKFPVVSKRSEVIVKDDVRAGLDSLWALHTSGRRQVVALVGPTGTGKTSLAYNLAARHGVGIMTFDAAGAREFSDWVGTTHLRDGKTEFVPSGFLTALDADGPYAGQHRMVLIDEVTRAESSGALNALIPVLHGFGTLYVPELGRGVSIDPTVMVLMSANRGSQYAGTVGLDLALADRVTAWVKMDYIEATREVLLVEERTGLAHDAAEALCSAAARVRQAAERGELPESGGISTRRILLAAEKATGTNPMTLHQAASWTWTGAYSDEGGTSSEATIVQSAIDAVLRGR